MENILTQHQKDYGLSVIEDADHFLHLLDPKGYRIATYHQSSVMLSEIQSDANRYMVGLDR